MYLFTSSTSKYPKTYTTLYPTKESQEKNIKKLNNRLEDILVDNNVYFDPVAELKDLLKEMKKEAV